jgi:hypothetical protein
MSQSVVAAGIVEFLLEIGAGSWFRRPRGPKRKCRPPRLGPFSLEPQNACACCGPAFHRASAEDLDPSLTPIEHCLSIGRIVLGYGMEEMRFAAHPRNA